MPQATTSDPVSVEDEIRTRTDIASTLGPFSAVHTYRVSYPPVVMEALTRLFREYNGTFAQLVALNREWSTDYQYCQHPDGTGPINFAAQIDMTGLSPAFLERATGMSVAEVMDELNRSIFEIENSIAMYQLLRQLFADGDGASCFQQGWDQALESLRSRSSMPIALLALTDEKYQSLCQTEFDRDGGDPPSAEEVKRLSGFDRFFGPTQFKRYVQENGAQCDYLLFVRASPPLSQLKKPDTPIEHPLLADDELRRLIKARAVTLNIDAPDMVHERRINDTKGYAAPMDLAYPITVEHDLYSRKFSDHLAANGQFSDFTGRGRLAGQLADFLERWGVDPERVASGERMMRCKPLKEAYGCYGHVMGPLSKSKVRQNLRRELRKRGGCVVQPEIPLLEAQVNGMACTAIDRVFVVVIDGEPHFIGGFRSLMPENTFEAQQGRNHGNGDTVWAEIVPA